MYFELKNQKETHTKYITYFNNKIFMSFLEKTSMFRIKVCQAVEYNVTGSSVTEERLIIVFTLVLSLHF